MSPTISTERVSTLKCQHCQRSFYAGHKSTKYCSDICRLAAWYNRKAVEQRDRKQ